MHLNIQLNTPLNSRYLYLLILCLPLAACGTTKTAWVKDGLTVHTMASAFNQDKAHCIKESYQTVPKPEVSPFHCGFRSPLWISNFHRSRHHGIGFGTSLGGFPLDDCNEPNDNYRASLAEYRNACMITKGWQQIEVKPIQPNPAR